MIQTVAESVATIACALFSDASIYINLVEHTARMECVTKLAANRFYSELPKGGVYASVTCLTWLSRS